MGKNWDETGFFYIEDNEEYVDEELLLEYLDEVIDAIAQAMNSKEGAWSVNSGNCSGCIGVDGSIDYNGFNIYLTYDFPVDSSRELDTIATGMNANGKANLLGDVNYSIVNNDAKLNYPFSEHQDYWREDTNTIEAEDDYIDIQHDESTIIQLSPYVDEVASSFANFEMWRASEYPIHSAKRIIDEILRLDKLPREEWQA